MACVECTTLFAWVQSTMAARLGMCGVYNIVYMGAVNNGSKTWHVWSVQYCLHGCSQQWRQDMACVECTTLFTWVQSTMAARHGMCGVYNIVYMGAVNNGSKTWLVWSVQHCLHGCSQQWQQDMACVECTTLFTWVQSTMAARHGLCGVYNIVYMGTVNNGSKTWHVLSVQHCLHVCSQQWRQDMACVECTTLFTWVQSTMAARHGLCGVYNIVYMGAVNNGSKTWHVWSVQHCLHGCSQQWQQDMACVECTTLFTWVQSTMAARHGMCGVYNIVYMGAVNNGSKTWLVWSVQHCLHGYSQQWQQDMACVECTTLFTCVQSTMAARHGMCGVYNIVYMGAVNNGSKTWLVWSVQHCLHGCSQQWQQDMACVECTTLFTWVQSTMAARHGMCGVYNIVYMGAVNNGSKTWHVWSVQHCLHGYSQQWQQDMACVECTTLFKWVQSTMAARHGLCGVYNIVYMGAVNNGSKTWLVWSVQHCLHGHSQQWQQDMASVECTTVFTWAQSTMAARHGLCGVFNIVYMGAVNNGSKTWHVWSVQHCLHGCSQQWQQDMACVECTILFTWVQSTMAARHGLCGVYNIVYMGTVNNGSKTWHVWSVQHCLHGCSQQWQQDLACVECTTLFTWVQSTMAARHGMCGVYNIVYIGAVNNGSKTWLVWSVQHCLHGCSQQWQQDMACVECTTLFTWAQSTMAARHGKCGVYNSVYMGTVNNGGKTWLVWSVQHCLHGCSQQWQQDMACVECSTLFTWVQSTMAARHGMCGVYNIVYMGAVNNGSKTWLVWSVQHCLHGCSQQWQQDMACVECTTLFTWV